MGVRKETHITDTQRPSTKTGKSSLLRARGFKSLKNWLVCRKRMFDWQHNCHITCPGPGFELVEPVSQQEACWWEKKKAYKAFVLGCWTFVSSQEGGKEVLEILRVYYGVCLTPSLSYVSAPCACLEPMEIRRRCQIPCDYRQL